MHGVSALFAGKPITWLTPLGLPVLQPYRSSGSYQVKTCLQVAPQPNHAIKPQPRIATHVSLTISPPPSPSARHPSARHRSSASEQPQTKHSIRAKFHPLDRFDASAHDRQRLRRSRTDFRRSARLCLQMCTYCAFVGAVQ